ncbi:MAG TPA: XdhC family protein, partial [Longimicrobium sp.]|nr:XdhC family protein [Longimicrobium sp.]
MTEPGRPLSAAEFVRLAREALEGGEPMASVTVIEWRPSRDQAPAPAAGARMAVWATRARGTLGDPRLDARAAGLAREAL